MTSLTDLQRAMQDGILGGGSGAETLLAQPPRGSRAQRLRVYQAAYGLRLTEFLSNDYEKLRCYLGETRFNAMARAYTAAHPSDTPNARWFSRHLPRFLQTAAPYSRQPELAELAHLEQALNDAFDAPDAPVVTMASLAAIDPSGFSNVCFDLAPALRSFAVGTNVSSLWSSLRCEEAPPAPEMLERPARLLVWRQASGSRFRILGEEEAMAIDCVTQGLSFGTICEMIAAFADPGSAAMRAASYLRGWIEAEIISGLRAGGGARK
jgi:hypothetical protein